MTLVQTVVGGLFDVMLAPFRTESPWPGLVALSLLTSVLVLLIFRVASNQAKVRRRRDRLLARVLELVLFKDDLVVNLGAFGRALVADAQYLGTLLVPLALSMVPVMLILVQAYSWFGLRPLLPGETALLTARFAPGDPALQQEVALTASEGLRIDSVPVRVPSRNEVTWRIRAVAGGQEWVDVAAGGRTERKSVGVGRELAVVSAQRNTGGLGSVRAWSRERPLPAGSPLERIEVGYPDRGLGCCGRSVNWVFAFFVLTMVFGVLLKKPLRVEL